MGGDGEVFQKNNAARARHRRRAGQDALGVSALFGGSAFGDGDVGTAPVPTIPQFPQSYEEEQALAPKKAVSLPKPENNFPPQDALTDQNPQDSETLKKGRAPLARAPLALAPLMREWTRLWTWPQDIAFIPRAPYIDDRDHLQKVTLTVKRGEHLHRLLRKYVDIAKIQHVSVAQALEKQMNLKKMRIGEKIHFSFGYEKNHAGGYKRVLKNLWLRPTPHEVIHVMRKNDYFYSSEKKFLKSKKRVFRVRAPIHSSFYSAARKAGIPGGMVQKIERIYSHAVAFQHEVHQSDVFDVLYTLDYDQMGALIDNGARGSVLYASLSVNNGRKKHEIWAYKPRQGPREFFYADGRSIQGFLLKTPLDDDSQISSSFGMRKHPVLGYSKMHKGIDFSARKGAPIYAAGNGRVVEMGRKGSYGNYIRIRHNNLYETAYAHLMGFAPYLKENAKIRQGETIGYVGSTGRSTGPHLHYETLMSGKAVDPLTVHLPDSRMLLNKDMQDFLKERARLSALLKEIPPQATQMASRALQTASLSGEAVFARSARSVSAPLAKTSAPAFTPTPTHIPDVTAPERISSDKES